jgi:hypothetical protein
MKKIYTFGDGYASSHIWPEWPVILEALFPDYSFAHHGAVGAGNEFIYNAIVQAHLENSEAYFLVQWAQAQRFDKLIEDSTWDDIIDTDPVYYFNRVQLAENQWWISSASQQPSVVNYHKHYIQSKQSRLRMLNYVYLVGNLLKNKSLFFSTIDLKFTKDEQQYVNNNNWVEENMFDFSFQPRFSNIRQTEVQPSPVVHLYYVKEYLLPALPFTVDHSRFIELERRINNHKWVAYDPDRVEIWQKMSDI